MSNTDGNGAEHPVRTSQCFACGQSLRESTDLVSDIGERPVLSEFGQRRVERLAESNATEVSARDNWQYKIGWYVKIGGELAMFGTVLTVLFLPFVLLGEIGTVGKWVQTVAVNASIWIAASLVGANLMRRTGVYDD